MILLMAAQNLTWTISSAPGGGNMVLRILVSCMALGAKSFIELSLNSEKMAYGLF